MRKFFLEQGIIDYIAVLDRPVFEATVDTSIAQLRRLTADDLTQYRVAHIEDSYLSSHRFYTLNQRERLSQSGAPLLAPATGFSAVLLKKIFSGSRALAQRALMCVGVQAYDQYAGHSKQLIERRAFHSDKKKNATFRPEIGGRDIIRYLARPPGSVWISYGDWLAHPRDAWFFQGERIVVREITGAHPQRIVSAVIDDNSVPYKSVLVVKIPDDQLADDWGHPVLVAILNSSLVSWILPLISNKQEKKTFPRVSLLDLKKIPIAKSLDESQHKEVVSRLLWKKGKAYSLGKPKQKPGSWSEPDRGGIRLWEKVTKELGQWKSYSVGIAWPKRYGEECER